MVICNDCDFGKEYRREVCYLSRISFVDYVMRDTVEPLPGTVVLCDLSPVPGVGAEHTGIYADDGKIIHRSGNGDIEEVTPRQFLQRLGGFNMAMSVYVSCRQASSLHLPDAANLARLSLTDPKLKGYELLGKNCHNFTRYCLTGDLDQGVLDWTFLRLEDLLIEEFRMDNWRVWVFPE